MTKKLDPLTELSRFSERALEQTEDAIRERKKLTDRFLREIEKEIEAAVRMLNHLPDPWKEGDRVDVEALRISLDKAMTARKKDRRDQLLRSWRDLLDLRTRRLELKKELAALSSTSR